ncbi:MAG TPA: MIP/aquaporin family protein [Micromonosporaceae bacterium]
MTLIRRLTAEFVGTGLLVTVMVGAGASAEALSKADAGLQLLETGIATGLGLAVLILMFGPVSGGHFNPVVSLVDWWLGRRAGVGLSSRDLGGYLIAQIVGGVVGAILANLMYGLPALTASKADRSDGNLLLAEVVATAGLVFVIFALARSGRAALIAPAVGGYIASAFWFTSSSAFANPAVTIGRVFTEAFTGIAPGSVPGFVVAQIVGAILALALVVYLYPEARQDSAPAAEPATMAEEA